MAGAIEPLMKLVHGGLRDLTTSEETLCHLARIATDLLLSALPPLSLRVAFAKSIWPLVWTFLVPTAIVLSDTVIDEMWNLGMDLATIPFSDPSWREWSGAPTQAATVIDRSLTYWTRLPWGRLASPPPTTETTESATETTRGMPSESSSRSLSTASTNGAGLDTPTSHDIQRTERFIARLLAWMTGIDHADPVHHPRWSRTPELVPLLGRAVLLLLHHVCDSSLTLSTSRALYLDLCDMVKRFYSWVQRVATDKLPVLLRHPTLKRWIRLCTASPYETADDADDLQADASSIDVIFDTRPDLLAWMKSVWSVL